jgi:hypothetical protein
MQNLNEVQSTLPYMRSKGPENFRINGRVYETRISEIDIYGRVDCNSIFGQKRTRNSNFDNKKLQNSKTVI